MPIVTGIKQHRRKPNCCEIFIDDECIGLLTIEAVYRLNLKEDLMLDPLLEKLLHDEIAITKCFNKACLILNKRAYSSIDVQRKLLQKEPNAAIVHSAIERLKQLGLLNDEAFARHLARSLFTHKHMGRTRIVFELNRHGIAREFATTIAHEISTEENVSEEDRALHLTQRRFRMVRNLDLQTQKRRLFGYLTRRGFSSETSLHAIERVLNSSK